MTDQAKTDDLDTQGEELEAIIKELEENEQAVQADDAASSVQEEVIEEPVSETGENIAEGVTAVEDLPTTSAPVLSSESVEEVVKPLVSKKANLTSIQGGKSKKPDSNLQNQVLTLELTGSVKLNFKIGSKQIELQGSENALTCSFGDGTEIKIPLDSVPNTKAKKHSA